jgi:hypothetical protein
MNRSFLIIILLVIGIGGIVIYYENNLVANTRSVLSLSNTTESFVKTFAMNIEQPIVNKTIFSYSNKYLEFVATEEFPITIFSSEKTHVEFQVINVPKGVWTEFKPTNSEIGPGINGSTTLIIVGAVKPFVPTPDNKTLTIIATSSNGKTVKSFLAITQTENFTILNDPGPIEFPNRLLFDQTGTSFMTYGVVYDPIKNFSNPLSVDLSVIGLQQNGQITNLPPWLKINIPEKVFLLNASQPYYFAITEATSHAPISNQTIVIKEIVDGQQFTRNLEITILKPIRI